ncbi:uncharacterized protein LOC143021533 [Oratosquilla oratoria]|uniref:uncharacterized protein LOC143021533 n=1 Tax=Oratosquilla oratoria TaxID=337810 RepID=UPI003F75CAA4
MREQASDDAPSGGLWWKMNDALGSLAVSSILTFLNRVLRLLFAEISVEPEILHLRLPVDFPKEAVIVAFARLYDRSLTNYNYNYDNNNHNPTAGSLPEANCGENNECLDGFRLKGSRKKAFRLSVTEHSVTILLNRRLNKIKATDSDPFQLRLELLKDNEVLVTLQLQIVQPFKCSAFNKVDGIHTNLIPSPYHTYANNPKPTLIKPITGSQSTQTLRHLVVENGPKRIKKG